MMFCIALPLCAQSQKPNIPDPIKFVNKFDQAANMVRAVFEDMGLSIELDDRKGEGSPRAPLSLLQAR